MKKDINKLRVRGFTLIELIVVIAIIGILAGILAPVMTTYYRKARIKEANADARMVFNAAQTAAQTFVAMDRVKTEPFVSAAKDMLIVSYNPTGGLRYSKSHSTWDSMDVVVASGGTGFVAGESDQAQSIADAIFKTVSDSEKYCWTVCISNYIVQGSVAATSMATDRVGFYTANKMHADDVTKHSYAQWLGSGAGSGGTEPDSLEEICTIYVNASPESPTEATT